MTTVHAMGDINHNSRVPALEPSAAELPIDLSSLDIERSTFPAETAERAPEVVRGALRVVLFSPDESGVHSAHCLEYFLTSYGDSSASAIERMTRMITRQENAWGRFSWEESQAHRDYLVGKISTRDLTTFEQSVPSGVGPLPDYRAPLSYLSLDIRQTSITIKSR